MTIRDLAEAEPVGAAGDRPVALPAPSAISAVSALSDVVDDADDGPDTTPVPTGLDAATPAALLAGEITARRASRPLSVFDLMRIGIGPSSSHTVGPMRAGRAFAGELAGVVVGAHESGRRAAAGRAAPGGGPDGPVTHLVVELYGSLGATGRGHATDRAVVMGLAGYEPETVPPEICQGLHEEVAAAGELVVDGVGALPFDPAADIRFLPGRVLPYHTNALTITAYCAAGDAVLRRTYYSVGGGFVMEDAGAPARRRSGPWRPRPRPRCTPPRRPTRSPRAPSSWRSASARGCASPRWSWPTRSRPGRGRRCSPTSTGCVTP